VPIPAQEHEYGRPTVARWPRGPASNCRSLYGRVAAILIVVTLVAIASAAYGSAADAPGQQPPQLTAAPSVSGTYREGHTLAADEGSWIGPDRDYDFRWARCDTSGASCDRIISAAAQNYEVTAADVGSTLRVVVTATNKNGSAVATSDATPVIAPALSTKTFTGTSSSTSTTSTTTSTSSTTTTNSTTAYFSDDFENGLGNWQLEPSYSTSLYKSVAGFAGKGIGLVTTGSSYGPNVNSEMTAIYLHPEACHAGWTTQRTLGQDTWYRVRVWFPSAYTPTTGDWNWIVAWHNDAVTSSYGAHSIAVGVYSDYPQVYGAAGNNPRLVLRLAGGSSSSPTYQSIELPSNSLVRGHWYNLVFHFVWHTDSSIGRAEWWVDGTQVVSTHFPTLYTNPDGRSSYNTCDLVNYHWVAPWTSEVDFDDVAIGPTRASVDS
jgi:hypothetical protein